MTTNPSRSQMSRRDALKLQGALAGSAAAMAAVPGVAELLSPSAAGAQEQSARPDAAPDLPPLAVIAINRLAFGPRPGSFDYNTFNSMAGGTDLEKLTSFVDWQLNPQGIDDSECDAKIAGANLSSLGKPLTQLWHEYYKTKNADRVKPLKDVRAATMLRAVYSKRQLFEVLVDFWHNHFNVFGWDYGYASATWAHYDRDVIRAHALGNFRTMLEVVGTSTAMLYYLDNFINQVAGFNENYARELCELHALGAENYLGVKNAQTVEKDANGVAIGYVDNDVYEIARCFTGWRINDGNWPLKDDQNTGTFLYYDAWHDKANKFVLGKYFPPEQASDPQRDGRAVYDLLAAHPGTGRYICRKLCRRLIGDEPPQSLVEAAAALFTAQVSAPDQIKQVVRFIILSEEFRAAWGQKVKRPFEAAAGSLRATNANFSPNDQFFWRLDATGQSLFAHRPPNGYPDVRKAWTNTTAMLKRWQLSIDVLEGSIEGTSADVVGQMPGSITTANEIADFWIGRILGRTIDATQRTRIVDFMRGARSATFSLPADEVKERLPRMVALILMSPEFQWR